MEFSIQCRHCPKKFLLREFSEEDTRSDRMRKLVTEYLCKHMHKAHPQLFQGAVTLSENMLGLAVLQQWAPEDPQIQQAIELTRQQFHELTGPVPVPTATG